MSDPAPPPPARPSPPEEEEDEEEEEEEGGGGGAAGTPPGHQNSVYRVGSRRCHRCLITFPDPAFAARHAKRQHPGDFARAALRGALFVCHVCSRPFGSSPALLRHQRGHAHLRAAPKRAPPPAEKATPTWSCLECGRGFAHEGALHRHYIGHARGEL